jgi:hypothetical protein
MGKERSWPGSKCNIRHPLCILASGMSSRTMHRQKIYFSNIQVPCTFFSPVFKYVSRTAFLSIYPWLDVF